MMDRLIASTLNSTILALIALTAGAALFLGYLGLMELFNGQAVTGGSRFSRRWRRARHR